MYIFDNQGIKIGHLWYFGRISQDSDMSGQSEQLLLQQS